MLLMTPALADGNGVSEQRTAPATSPQILLQADRISYDTRANVVTAEGHVIISDAQRTLRADRVSYDQNTDMVTADGNISILDANGNVAFADHVNLTDDLRDGALQGFSAVIGENGRLAASSANRREGRYTVANGAVFTPCAICAESGDTTPLWQIRAARITHDSEEKKIVYEDASLQFYGTTIFYFPYFSMADPTVKRQSGLLLPSFGSSSDIGSYAEVPYFWAINPYTDITLAPFVTTHAGQLLKGEYRQHWTGGGTWLQGSLGYDDNLLNTGQSAWLGHLFGSGRTALSDTWRVGFDVQLASSDTYMKRYQISNLDRLTSSLFVDHVEGRSRAAITGYYFQSLRSADSAGKMPLVLPQAEYTYIPEHKVWDGRLRIDTSALSIQRDTGTDTTRASVAADWRLPFTMENGQLITFEALARSDLYYVRNLAGGTGSTTTSTSTSTSKDTQTVGRGLAAAVAEWRWPFVKASANTPVTYVIEPIVQLVVSPYGGNSSSIPNEDSQTVEFDETDLFAVNNYPGLDRWTGGPRLNAGLRFTATMPMGNIEAIIGQNYRAKPDLSFSSGSGTGERKSDVIGRFTINLPPYIDLTHRFEIDEQTGEFRRNEVYLQGHYGKSSVELSYLKLSSDAAASSQGPREEVFVDTTINVYDDWSVFASARRNLEQGQMIESRFGVRYEDECFIVSLGYSRSYVSDQNLPPSTSVLLRIGLKSGALGDSF
jgi:LPS-assembly protein